MTWDGLCPVCHTNYFRLTVNSEGKVHVNCWRESCAAYIGTMEAGAMLHPPVPAEH